MNNFDKPQISSTFIMDYLIEQSSRHKKTILLLSIFIYLSLAFVLSVFYLNIINGIMVAAYMVYLIVMYWNNSLINNLLVMGKVFGALLLGVLCVELLNITY